MAESSKNLIAGSNGNAGNNGKGILLPDGAWSSEEKDLKKFGGNLSPGKLTKYTSSFYLPILLSLKGDIRNPVFAINLVARTFDEIEDCLLRAAWWEQDPRPAGLHDLYNFFKGESLEHFGSIDELVNTFIPAITDPRRKFLVSKVSNVRDILCNPKVFSKEEKNIVLEYMKNMKEGMAKYLGGGIHTKDDLLMYCRRVAGIPGLAVHEMVDARRGGMPSRESANNLGLALQLTNVIRDIRGDLNEGRSYLVEKGVFDGIDNIRDFLLERPSLVYLKPVEKEALKLGHDKIVGEFAEYALLSLGYVYGTKYRDYNVFTQLLLAEASMRMKESHINWEHLDEDLARVFYGKEELNYPKKKKLKMFARLKFGLYSIHDYQNDFIQMHIDYLNKRRAA